MANERITEDIVIDHFKNDALFKSIKFEEQRSAKKTISSLLKGQSKSKGKGDGCPEFIISFPTDSRYIIIVECKASPTMHRSKTLDKPITHAVDGVLHYAKALSGDYTVLAIAVSGETKSELLISHFLWKKGEKKYKENKADNNLLSIKNYLRMFENEQFSDTLLNVDITAKAIELNQEYNDYSVPEQIRNTMVSAILLSLIDTPFRQSYVAESTTNSLGESMMKAIKTTLSINQVRNENAMVGEFSKLLNEPLFKLSEIKRKNQKTQRPTIEVLKEIIQYLHNNIYPLLDMNDSGFDVLGRFYTEFIRYAGSEQKQGLVLTPSHITNLFCDLAQITEKDVIYDPCCGTAGFLISAMKALYSLVGSDEDKKHNIRSNQLVGVELRPSMYTYACANMMLRGDGKSNIYQGDCFQLKGSIKTHKPTVAFLNPPYDVGTAEQMRFIKHALDVVSPQNGRVVAIVQMSCAIKNEKELIAVKNQILASHHLKAVLSMPDDLFYPVGVVTCIMIFEANKPNKGLKTWFGYFKNDGFEKRKHQGRIDARGRFKDIRSNWLKAYYDSEDFEGLYVKKEVIGEDEWCAEAYMKTDYSTLKLESFEKKMKDYIAFMFLNDIENYGRNK